MLLTLVGDRLHGGVASPKWHALRDAVAVAGGALAPAVAAYRLGFLADGGSTSALLEWANALLILAFMQIDGLKCYPDIADVQDGVVVAAAGAGLGEALLPSQDYKCPNCDQPKKGHVCPHA